MDTKSLSSCKLSLFTANPSLVTTGSLRTCHTADLPQQLFLHCCVCVSVCVIQRVPGFQNKPQMFPFWCGQEEGATSCWRGGAREGWLVRSPSHLCQLSDTNTHTHTSKKHLMSGNLVLTRGVGPHNVGALPGSPQCNISKNTLSCITAAVRLKSYRKQRNHMTSQRLFTTFKQLRQNINFHHLITQIIL